MKKVEGKEINKETLMNASHETLQRVDLDVYNKLKDLFELQYDSLVEMKCKHIADSKSCLDLPKHDCIHFFADWSYYYLARCVEIQLIAEQDERYIAIRYKIH